MKNMFCTKNERSRWSRKYYRDATGLWFEIDADNARWPATFVAASIEGWNRYDCNECKHKLTCLIDRTYVRVFTPV